MATSKTPIREILLNAITQEGGAQWSAIAAAVSEQHTVKNWLTQVRGPLQGLMNEGLIKRSTGSGVTGPEHYEAA